jgi:Ca2+-transporting ATPase
MAFREIPGPGPKPTPPQTRRIERLLTWTDLDSWSPGEDLDEPWHALVEMAVLASRGDPVDAMELAIQRMAAEHLRTSEHLHPDWPLEREYPLQANLLVVSRLWRDARGQGRLAAKGAPEAIADLCHLTPEAARGLQQAADQLAAEGLRVLAVARGLEGIPMTSCLSLWASSLWRIRCVRMFPRRSPPPSAP